MIASSNESPATLSDWEMDKPPNEMTPISVVPPPMSMTSVPCGVQTSMPAPMAAATGSGIE